MAPHLTSERWMAGIVENWTHYLLPALFRTFTIWQKGNSWFNFGAVVKTVKRICPTDIHKTVQTSPTCFEWHCPLYNLANELHLWEIHKIDGGWGGDPFHRSIKSGHIPPFESSVWKPRIFWTRRSSSPKRFLVLDPWINKLSACGQNVKFDISTFSQGPIWYFHFSLGLIQAEFVL